MDGTVRRAQYSPRFGVVFEEPAPVMASAPNRSDIACFVGYVPRRGTQIPPHIQRWLAERGWNELYANGRGLPLFRSGDLKQPRGLIERARTPNSSFDTYLRDHFATEAPQLLDVDERFGEPSVAVQRTLALGLNTLLYDPDLYSSDRFAAVALPAPVQRQVEQGLRGSALVRLNRVLLEAALPGVLRPSEPTRLDDLLDVPVPIDSWDVFDQLFAWEQRAVDGHGRLCTTYIGAAVRSFFAQGGRKCYIARVGDPWLVSARNPEPARDRRIERLIPGYPQLFEGSATDQHSWHGIGHLFGLPDVSFLCMPDLADAVRVERAPVPVKEARPVFSEQFVECGAEEPLPPANNAIQWITAPRCDDHGYRAWALAVRHIADLLFRQQREVQLVAAVPIPTSGSPARQHLLDYLVNNPEVGRPLGAHPAQKLTGIASAFVQLVYPWVRTMGSGNLPEQLESPDAVLVGLLARSALTQGSFHSAAGLHLADVFDTGPALSRDQLLMPVAVTNTDHRAFSLLERVSIFGQTPRGLRLLSDVTTSLDEHYRPASMNRLVISIVRAARRLGEEMVFEASGERLWGRLRDHLQDLLAGLLQAGALRGATPREAFTVRCDRSTMTQNDIDNGRAVVELQFAPAAPIERITVVLAMDEGGKVSLAAPRLPQSAS